MTEPKETSTIALIHPPTNAVTVTPPLGLGYLASSAQKAGFGVKIYDLARRHIDLAHLRGILAETKPPYIGLTVSTPNYLSAKGVAEMLHGLAYKPTIILGGPHVSFYPAEALDEFHGDFVVCLEGERTLVDLLRTLQRGGDPESLRGIAFKKGDGIIKTEAAKITQNLDDLPWPAWDLIEPHLYPPIPHQLFVRHLPVAPVLTTRGCPFACPFCSVTSLFGAAIRCRSPEDVVAEMQLLIAKFGIREIHLEDDNPTLNIEHMESLCEQMLSGGISVPWKFPNGIMVHNADDSLLTTMRDAGCYQISLGIETANEQSDLGKSVSLVKVQEITKTARRLGMQTVGLFVLGLPNETEAMTNKTIKLSRRLGLRFAHFGIYIPLPGSRWGDEIQQKERSLESLNFFTAYQKDPVAAAKMKSYQRKAVLLFYLRPLTMWRLLSMIKFRQITGFINTFVKYVFG